MVLKLLTNGNLQAFHNKKSIKKKYLQRLLEHYKQDEIIHGVYWENGKGCAVGCTVHSSSHQCYEQELGIPRWLAYLEDKLFEALKNDRAKQFPIKFLKSIPIGVTKEQFQEVYHEFCIFILSSLPEIKNEKVSQVVADVIILHKTREQDDKKWSAARAAAWSAARSAESEAWSEESAARSTESVARSAAESAARSTESVARSGESAARAAGWSAEAAAWSAESEAWSEESAAYEKMADKLLELLKNSAPDRW